MDIFWCLVYLAVVLLVGYAILSAAAGPSRRGLSEVLGLSLPLGAGGVGVLLLWSSLIGWAPSEKLLLNVGLLGLVATVVLWRWKRLVRPTLVTPGEPIRPLDWLSLAPAALAAYLVVVVGVQSVGYPRTDMDGWAIWGMKAKVLAREPLASHPAFFHEHDLSFTHQDYPLLVPILEAGVYGAIGRVDDQVGKLVFWMLYVCLGSLAYRGLRWRLARAPASALAAVLMALPVAVRWAGVGTADAPITAFYTGAVFLAAKWLRDQRREDLVLAILLATFTALVKNEGKAMAGLLAGVVLVFSLWPIRKGRLLGAAAYGAGVALLLAPWLWYSAGLPRTHENYGDRLSLANLSAGADQLGVVLAALKDQITLWARWGPLWLLLPAAAVLGYRGFARRHVLALWSLLVLHVGLYVAVYMVTPWGAAKLIPGTLDRLLLHVTPVAVLLVGYHWAEVSGTGLQPAPEAEPPEGRAA